MSKDHEAVTPATCEQVRRERAFGRGIKLGLAAMLLTTAGLGLALNRTTATDSGAEATALLAALDPAEADWSPLAAPVEPGMARFDGTGLATGAGAETLRLAELVPPPNPFQRTPALPPAEPEFDPEVTIHAAPASGWGAPASPPAWADAAPADGLPVRPPFGLAPEAPVAPQPAAPPEPTLEESLRVTGIIRGEPSLAVIRHAGQTLFLKVGDDLDGTWRLEAIQERSVVFRLGQRRLEVAIQGGG